MKRESTAPPANSAAARAAERRAQALKAIRRLSKVDPRLHKLIAKIGHHRPLITPNPFVALVGAVIQQQVSMGAAAAIQQRVKALCPRKRVTPKAIAALDHDTLRRAGLSRQKARYVHDLAEHFLSGKLSTRRLRRMSDEEVMATTTQVKGVGRWTAEMLLIFCLERPDVWPITDLGLRKAVALFLGLKELPDDETMNRLAEPWRPYRTYASWYLWRSLEGPFMPGMEL